MVSTDHCFLQPEAFDRAAASLLQWMQATNVPAYDEKEGTGLIRHLFLRKSSKDMMACIVATGPVRGDVVDALRAGCPELTGVLLCRNDAPGNVVMTNDIQVLWGSDTVEEVLCGARFLLSPNTFFQVNTAQTETLYSIVGQYAQPAGKTVLDLYCGAGTIGLSVAREAKRIIGNDITPSAIENAARNAALNGIQAEYYCGDARDIARKLAQDGLRPDVIITDPPRKGMDETVLSALVTMAPDTIVYVSCDPGTLARDLKRLSEKGYAATACTAVDMFPGTKHVETVVAL